MYCKLPKKLPPPGSLLLGKSWGVCSNMQLVLCICPHHSSWCCYAWGQYSQRQQLPSGRTAISFVEHVLREISGAGCVDTKLRSIEATCITKGQSRVDSYTSDQVYSDFVCVCMRTQSMKELNQKLAKSIPTRRSLHFTQGKYTDARFRNQGLKKGEGICSKGAYFWELTVYFVYLYHQSVSFSMYTWPHSDASPPFDFLHYPFLWHTVES